MATEAQVAANQKNAQLSTGPTSPDGKVRSSHNAVKTGLTGQTVLLPTDDVAVYKTHVARLNKQFQPASDEELTLVQAIADTEWRLLRIPSLEAGIRAIGRTKLADLYANETDPATRASFIEAEVQLVYRKDLTNLALQETRLRRHREVDTEKLEKLQQARKLAEKPRKNITAAVQMYNHATRTGHTFVPQLFGFDFSIQQIRDHIELESFKEHMLGREKTMSAQEYQAAFDRFVPVP